MRKKLDTYLINWISFIFPALKRDHCMTPSGTWGTCHLIIHLGPEISYIYPCALGGRIISHWSKGYLISPSIIASSGTLKRKTSENIKVATSEI